MTVNECKYKFINKESKMCCSLFNKQCDDIDTCGCNCQVFEDYKLLSQLQTELRAANNRIIKLVIALKKALQRKDKKDV